jgi:hypothetical protein
MTRPERWATPERSGLIMCRKRKALNRSGVPDAIRMTRARRGQRDNPGHLYKKIRRAMPKHRNAPDAPLTGTEYEVMPLSGCLTLDKSLKEDRQGQDEHSRTPSVRTALMFACQAGRQIRYETRRA